MRTFRDAKIMAKALRKGLSERQIDTTHSDCLELVARQFGFENWNILSARINDGVADSTDQHTECDSTAPAACRDSADEPSRWARVSKPWRIPSVGIGWRRLGMEALSIAIPLLLMFGSETVLAQPFRVPSGSMEPTLQIGDELLASKFAYGYGRSSLLVYPGPGATGRLFGRIPERGDVVVFRLPRDPSVHLVKRMIGLPGDRVQMRAGRLWINGAPVPLRDGGRGDVEFGNGQRIQGFRYIETLPGGHEHPILKLAGSSYDDTPEMIVPARCLFMLGDNRDDSLDSRVAAEDGGVGFVPLENLVGRADVVLGSWDFPGVGWNPVDWMSRVRVPRFFSHID